MDEPCVVSLGYVRLCWFLARYMAKHSLVSLARGRVFAKTFIGDWASDLGGRPF